MDLINLLIHIAQNSWLILLGMAGIGFLIGFHELGHFLFAKLFNVKTPSFSIGMGPRIFTKKIGETEFALSALPLGGYVEISGFAEVGQGDQKEAIRNDERSFSSKPYWQKMLIISGGVIFNTVFSYAVLSALFYFGMPASPLFYRTYATTQIKQIITDSPASTSNLQPDDTIVGIDDLILSGPATELFAFIKTHPNQTVTMHIKRNGSTIDLPVTIGSQMVKETPIGFLGIEFCMPRFSLLKSIQYGIRETNRLIVQIFSSFKQLFAKRDVESLGGPLMIISHTIEHAKQGASLLLLFLAFISINLAVLNVLPIPIMDGGQALFVTIEAMIGRQLPLRLREAIHIACWFLLVLLFLFLSYKDIVRIFFTNK